MIDAIHKGSWGRGKGVGGEGERLQYWNPVMGFSHAVKDSLHQHFETHAGIHLREVRADRGRLRDGELDSAFPPCLVYSVTSCGNVYASLS